MTAPSKPMWRTAYRPSERWLHNNGFPAFVTHYARPTSWGRRVGQLLVGTFVWWLILFSLGSATMLGFAFDEYADRVSDDPELAPTIDDVEIEVLLGEPAASGVLTWLAPLCLLVAALLAIFAVGRMLIFSLRWFAIIAYRQQGRMIAILPLLLVAVLFFFLAAETWQSVGRLRNWNLTFTMAIFVLLTLAFVIRRAQVDAESMGTFEDAESLVATLPPIREFRRSLGTRLLLNLQSVSRRGRLSATAARTYQYQHITEPMLQRAELTWLERFNLRMVAVVGRALVALLVAVVITLFFLVFGFAALDLPTATAWLGSKPTVILRLTFDGSTFLLFAEGLRVSIFLGVFSALYFVVSSGADKEFSEALEEETESHLRAALALRAYTRGLD